MKRKMIALMLGVLVLMPTVAIDLSTITASAETENGFTYWFINDGTEVEITGYTGLDHAVAIPSTIEGKPVVSIGNNAFNGRSMASVAIPDSVISIGSYVFYRCSSLTSVDIGDGVVSIGSHAFAECTALTYITVPGSVTSIGDSAFYGCTALRSVTMGHGATTIGGSAFENCAALTSIVIPDSVTSIGSYAFAYCSSLTSVTVSAGLKIIESWTFARCTALTHIIIPDGVTSIGWLAFNGCTSLASVNLGQGLKSIGNSAFYGCTGLTTIEFPDNVTSIGTNAFCGCSALASVEIPDHVTRLDIYAFAECASLTSISVDEDNPNYASIDGVLYDKGLALLMQFPGGKRGEFAVPDSVTRIDGRAFAYSAALTSVAIGERVMMIDNSAFWYCAALTSISVDEDNPNYASIDGVLYNKDRSELIQYPGGRSGPFTVPNGVTSIGTVSFAGSALTSITIPDNVIVNIQNDAFRDCTALVSIDIGDGVADIGGSAFIGCIALSSVDLGSGVTYIGANAFSACTSLTSIVVPDSVYGIGPGAFQSCSSLSSIVMGDHVAYIDRWAFAGCTALTAMIFTGNAPDVQEYWDQGCSELTAFYRQSATGFSTPSWNGDPCYPLGQAPTAPNGFTATPSDGRVTLSWTTPSYVGDSDIDYYVVYQDGVEVKNVTETSAEITGLTNGQTYGFKVAAHTTAGVGQPSATILIRTSTITLLYPDTIYLTSGTVQIEWAFEGNIYDLDEILIDVNGKRANVSADATSYLLENLSDGTHVVKVIAVNMDGHAVQDEATFVIDTVAPTVVSRSPMGIDESTVAVVSVTFSEAMDNGSVSIIIGGVEGTISWDGNTATFRPNSLLKGNTEHLVSVSGMDIAGNELGTTAWKFTTANVGTISGTVKDKDGNPIPGSTVALKSTSTSSRAGVVTTFSVESTLGRTLTTTTNTDGEYAFYDVSVGEYVLSMEKSGYETVTYDLKVTSDAIASGGVSIDGTLPVDSWLEGNTMIVIGAVASIIVAVVGAVLLVRKRSRSRKLNR